MKNLIAESRAIWSVRDNTLYARWILSSWNQDIHKLENLSYNRALIDNDDNNNKIILDLQSSTCSGKFFYYRTSPLQGLLMEPGPKERITAASESLGIIDSVRYS